MCGLFGVIRPRRYPQHLRSGAASALLDLGYLAEERGVDSAGLATLHSRTLPADSDLDRDLQETTIGRWRVVTALGPFSEKLPEHPRVRSNLRTARVVLGHTRWATQGSVVLSNASPMVVGDVIGSHNGDVTAPRDPGGRTDSAWLFGQLDRARSIAATVAVMAGVRGRAALAWARRAHSDLVFLGRTALSPLWTATDDGGALWWASNPAWLREVSSWRGLDLPDPMPLLEGTLMVLHSDADQVTVVRADQPSPGRAQRPGRGAARIHPRGSTPGTGPPGPSGSGAAAGQPDQLTREQGNGQMLGH